MFSSLVLPEFNGFCSLFKYSRESPATFDLPVLQIFFGTVKLHSSVIL